MGWGERRLGRGTQRRGGTGNCDWAGKTCLKRFLPENAVVKHTPPNNVPGQVLRASYLHLWTSCGAVQIQNESGTEEMGRALSRFSSSHTALCQPPFVYTLCLPPLQHYSCYSKHQVIWAECSMNHTHWMSEGYSDEQGKRRQIGKKQSLEKGRQESRGQSMGRCNGQVVALICS